MPRSGYLEWYESESSEKPLLAPLLLHQIDIERKLVYSKYQYNIGSLGEETEVNETLYRGSLPCLGA